MGKGVNHLSLGLTRSPLPAGGAAAKTQKIDDRTRLLGSGAIDVPNKSVTAVLTVVCAHSVLCTVSVRADRAGERRPESGVTADATVTVTVTSHVYTCQHGAQGMIGYIYRR